MMKIVQEDHTFGYWKGKTGKGKSFVKLSNFGIKLKKHVRAPKEMPQYSGFVVEVTQKQRTSRSSRESTHGSFVARG